MIREHKSPRLPYLPAFTGGLVGYFSYDYLKYSEPSLRLDAEDTEGFKDVDLMLFDKVIAFDNYRQKILLIVNIRLENPEEEYNRALLELDTMERLIREGKPCREQPGVLRGAVRAPVRQGNILRDGGEGKAPHLRRRHLPDRAFQPAGGSV